MKYRNTLTMRLKYLVAACVLGLTVGAANATTYDYVGPVYNSTPLATGYVYDPALGTNMTGSVTFNIDTSDFSGEIATTLYGGLVATALVMTSGAYSLSLAQNELYGLFGFTNGQITFWSVCGNAAPGGCDGTALNPVGVAGDGLSYLGAGGSIHQPEGDTVQESATGLSCASPGYECQTVTYGARTNANCYYDQPNCVPTADYGFWTEVATNATPLPAALPLFASGLGALGLLGWRRKRKGAALAA